MPSAAAPLRIPSPTIDLRAPRLERLPASRLRAMLAAGAEAEECRRVLERAEINFVSEVLRGQGEFLEYEHYPREDVFDHDTGAQYYYHAHRAGGLEHGHFHTFLRQPRNCMHGASDSTRCTGQESADTVTHLVAISMDAYGWPIGLFATNHWVCGGDWMPASGVIDLLPGFRIDHAYPSWPVNRWLGAMLVLFGPHIESLLRHRDAVIEAWARQHPGQDAFEDRELEITGYFPISVEETVNEVRELAGLE